VADSEVNVKKGLIHSCTFMLHPITAGQNRKNSHILKNSWAVSNQNVVINKGVRAISFRKLQI